MDTRITINCMFFHTTPGILIWTTPACSKRANVVTALGSVQTGYFGYGLWYKGSFEIKGRSNVLFGVLLQPKQQMTPCSPISCQLPVSVSPDHLWGDRGHFFTSWLSPSVSVIQFPSPFPSLFPFPCSPPSFSPLLQNLQPWWEKLQEAGISRLKKEYQKEYMPYCWARNMCVSS